MYKCLKIHKPNIIKITKEDYQKSLVRGRPHFALYVTPRDAPYQRLQDVSCRGYVNVSIWSNM